MTILTEAGRGDAVSRITAEDCFIPLGPRLNWFCRAKPPSSKRHGRRWHEKTGFSHLPGRGTYNAAELGYLQTHHAARQDVIGTVDAVRTEKGQVTVSQLDNADKYAPSVHMTGDNASALIYACAMADFAAIDRERFEIVAVTGNSMGWYLALACAGIVDLAGGARLVNNMGGIMHQHGTGGQIVWSVVDDDWKIAQDKILFVNTLLDEGAYKF